VLLAMQVITYIFVLQCVLQFVLQGVFAMCVAEWDG